MSRRMVTVLHPNYKPNRYEKTPPGLSDYILVPWLDTIGGWHVKELLSFEEIKMLAVFANKLQAQPRTTHRRAKESQHA